MNKASRGSGTTPTKKNIPLDQLKDLFVPEYLKDLNAKQAAIRIGIHPKRANQQGHRLLMFADVQEKISKVFQKINAKAEVSAEFVLRELLQIANCDPADAYNEDGSLKSIHDIPIAVRKTISSIESDEIWEYEQEGRKKVKVQVGEVKKIKFWPKDRGLEMLGKYLALFVERQRQEGPNGEPLPAVQVHVHSHKILPITDAITRPAVAEAASPNAA